MGGSILVCGVVIKYNILQCIMRNAIAGRKKGIGECAVLNRVISKGPH